MWRVVSSISPSPLSTPTQNSPWQGGFLPEMTRREAALILGLRESAPQERVREAHRRIMIANHPDAGRRTSGENWRALASLSQNERSHCSTLSLSKQQRRLLLPGN